MVSYFSPPELNAESILIAKALGKLVDKYNIDLITAGNLHGKKDEQLADLANLEAVNRIVVDTLNKPAWFGEGAIRDSIWYRYVDYVWEARAKQHYREKKYDFIYSRSQPGISHMVAHQYKKQLHIPWVAQFSDPWANNPFHKYGQARLKRKEEEIVQYADVLVFPTEEIRKLYESTYPAMGIRSKSYVIPHCFEDSLYPNEAGSKKEKMIVSYIGDFYGLRSPVHFLEAMELALKWKPDLVDVMEFHIWGYLEPRYKELIDSFQSIKEMIHIHNQTDYLDSLSRMKTSDILILIDAPSEENLFLSSKLIDYFGSRKPILGVTPEVGSAADYLRQFGFPVVDPLNISDIAANLLDMIDRLHFYKHRAEKNNYTPFSTEEYVRTLCSIFKSLEQNHRMTAV